MSELVANISVDTINGHIYALDDIIGEFIDNRQRPYFKQGDSWYSRILITSREVEGKDVDKLLRATSNAMVIAEEISDNFNQYSFIDAREDTFAIHKQFWLNPNIQDTEELAYVGYDDGEIIFIVRGMGDVIWKVIEV